MWTSFRHAALLLASLASASDGAWFEVGDQSPFFTDVVEDGFGDSLSFAADGNTLAVGVPKKGVIGRDSETDNMGNVQVYSFDGTTWNQVGSDIVYPDDSAKCYNIHSQNQGCKFGGNGAIALSDDGTRIVISARYIGSQHNYNDGKAYIYKYDGSSWVQEFAQFGEAPGDYFGTKCEMSADGLTAACSSQHNNGMTGYVIVWRYDGAAWAQIGSTLYGMAGFGGERHGYGIDLSADGNILAVGCPYYSPTGNSADKTGKVRVYQFDGTDWNQFGNDVFGDMIGFAVHLTSDGKKLASGTAEVNEYSHIKVFSYESGAWTLTADVDADIGRLYKMHMSDDGSVLVAISAGAGPWGTKGQQKVFGSTDGATYTQLGPDILGGPDYGQQDACYMTYHAKCREGYWSALSRDGTRLALTSYPNDYPNSKWSVRVLTHTALTSHIEHVAAAKALADLTYTIDPNGKAVLDANGYATLDADSGEDIPISLTIQTKNAHVDVFKVSHPATTGTLTDNTATDGRYILTCPQAAGVKTVHFTVERPENLTAFGGEWLKLYPKDSFANTTNEYEPFTFNEFGAKIPLPEFRPTSSGLANDAPISDFFHVFMEVKDEGDFELRYGNPYLRINQKWIAIEFKSTFLRVGAPWADCTGSTLSAPSYSLGSIMPVLFGGPNVNSIAQKAGLPSYDDVIAELSGVAVPVKVVLEIFNADKTSYTSSSVDGVCYKAGNPCPEAHAVCKAEYCEIDVWEQIIAGFKAASPGKVTVLGSVDASTSTSQYSMLSMDGFYFVGTDVEAGYTGTSVAAIGTPLFDASAVDDATVYVTLAGSALGSWSPFSWYSGVSPAKWAAIVTEASDTSAIASLLDRGYGWFYLTSETGFEVKSTMTPAVLSAIEGLDTTRRLQGRGLQASEPYWGCDDTLFECKPVCLRDTGVVTSRVSDKLCAGAPKNMCACKCFHQARWACEGESVVCKAKFGAGELKTVGDKVCETRGAPKPEATAQHRVASECTPVTGMRGSAPTAVCLAEWGEPTPTEAPETPTTETPAPTAAAPADEIPLTLESFAAPLALAALALYAS